MKLLTTLILLFSLCATGYCKDYTYYYRHAQYAEEYLLDGDFKQALNHYDSAFRGYDFKFARDCYIAAQIAAYSNNHELTYKYLCYCVKAGVRLGCLLRRNIFIPFKQSAYNKKLEEAYPYLWKQYIRSIDTNLNKHAAQRYLDEQNAKSGPRAEYWDIVDNNVDRKSVV